MRFLPSDGVYPKMSVQDALRYALLVEDREACHGCGETFWVQTCRYATVNGHKICSACYRAAIMASRHGIFDIYATQIDLHAALLKLAAQFGLEVSLADLIGPSPALEFDQEDYWSGEGREVAQRLGVTAGEFL